MLKGDMFDYGLESRYALLFALEKYDGSLALQHGLSDTEGSETLLTMDMSKCVPDQSAVWKLGLNTTPFIRFYGRYIPGIDFLYFSLTSIELCHSADTPFVFLPSYVIVISI